MEIRDTDLFAELERVQAPPGFEERLLERLQGRKRKRVQLRVVRLSLAGALAAAAALFLILEVVPPPGGGGMGVSAKSGVPPAAFERGIPPRPGDMIPVIETVDYSGEIRSRRPDTPTIYILEQCSDRTDREIKY